MSGRPSRTIRAHDVDVKLRRPVLAALASLLTAGIWGSVHHFRTTSEVERFGRARGQMPFAFTPVAPGTSTVAWLAGLLAWYLVAGVLVAVGFAVADGDSLGTEDITSFTTLVLLLAPLWLTAAGTMRRIRTVQHLAGVTGPFPSPLRAALLSAVFPPLGTWYAQRQLNRAWRQYS